MKFRLFCSKHQLALLRFEKQETAAQDVLDFYVVPCPECEKESPEAAAKFWSLVYRPRGMTAKQVRAELTDFHFLLEQVPKIYMHITGGRLSKTNYTADAVIGVADEHLEDQLEWAATEFRQVEYRIRQYLAFSHQDGKCHIYGDDGELQCGNLARHGRTIDFRREPLSDLLDVIKQTRMRDYAASQKPPASGTVPK